MWHWCRAKICWAPWEMVDNNSISLLQISNGQSARAYWLDATIHAREWLATTTLMKITNQVCRGGAYNTASKPLYYLMRFIRWFPKDLSNQSINQTSIAPISPAKPGSVARQPNQCSTAKSRKQFRKVTYQDLIIMMENESENLTSPLKTEQRPTVSCFKSRKT